MSEDLGSAERARRAAESERDELQEEINNNSNKGYVSLSVLVSLFFIFIKLVF